MQAFREKPVSIQSCIYLGRVRHRRFQPAEHAFSYRMFMMYLDLGEMPDLFDRYWLWSAKRPAPAWFRRSDHLGNPDIPLDEALRDLVGERTGTRPQGPVRLLTHLRYLGYCFNPVSFYYCFDASGQNLETIVAEVDNTPWGERHCYVLTEAMNTSQTKKKRYQFDKQFHVSPFMSMEMQYDWRFAAPGPVLVAHLENLIRDKTLFDATLTLTRREITGSALTKVLAAHPLMTGKVMAAIYWQALRLWLKKNPVYTHPSKGNFEQEVTPS
jgi:DUF1365 family protein